MTAPEQTECIGCSDVNHTAQVYICGACVRRVKGSTGGSPSDARLKRAAFDDVKLAIEALMFDADGVQCLDIHERRFYMKKLQAAQELLDKLRGKDG